MIYLSRITEFQLVRETRNGCIHAPPQAGKNCVFCKSWISDAIKSYKNSIVGYEYDGNVRGKCTKKNGAATMACYSCRNYVPSQEAERLL